jgi:hypothetical protein
MANPISASDCARHDPDLDCFVRQPPIIIPIGPINTRPGSSPKAPDT